MNETPTPLPPEPEQSQGPSHSDLAISKRRRWLLAGAGFLGWYIVNGLFWLIYMQLAVKNPNAIYGLSPYLDIAMLATVVNVILLIVLALIRRTRWIALGVLGAWAVNLAISLVLGLSFNALCLTPFFTPLK